MKIRILVYTAVGFFNSKFIKYKVFQFKERIRSWLYNSDFPYLSEDRNQKVPSVEY
jgi:hypothetical protein